MECPDIVKELVRGYIWRQCSDSDLTARGCDLDASERRLMRAKLLEKFYPVVVNVLRASGTEFNVPSATIIAGFSQATTPALESEEGAICGICTDLLSDMDIGTLPCRHTLHMRCLEKHLCDRHTCPLCRAVLPQGIDHADVVDTQARQVVRSLLRAGREDWALSFAHAELTRMLSRAWQDRSTWNKRNFAMALVAVADCCLRTGSYTQAYRIAQFALGLFPQLSGLQRAEILRLQANALSADDGLFRLDRDSPLLYTPAVDALFRAAYRLDPVQYQGPIGDNFARVAVWTEEDPLVNRGVVHEFRACLQEQRNGGPLRIHCQ